MNPVFKWKMFVGVVALLAATATVVVAAHSAFAVLRFTESFQIGNVREVVLSDVRNLTPCQAHLPGRRLAHRREGLTLDRSPVLELR